MKTEFLFANEYYFLHLFYLCDFGNFLKFGGFHSFSFMLSMVAKPLGPVRDLNQSIVVEDHLL